jgi:chorismate mutase/prephenate dehydratase
MAELKDLRRRIDGIDAELVRLLNERAAAAVLIGLAKREGRAPIHDRAREEEVLGRVRSANRGPLTASALEEIYRKIIRACSVVQRASSSPARAAPGKAARGAGKGA